MRHPGSFLAFITFLLIFISSSESKRSLSKRQTVAFTTPQYSFCLTTLTTGAPVGIVAANTGTGTVYSLPSNAYLGINPTTGLLYLTSNLASSSSNTLTVRATYGSSSATASVTVRAAPCSSSTSPPVFSSSSYSFQTTGCIPGSLLGIVTATGAATVSYSLSGANSAYIAVSPSTGQLYLNARPTTNPISFVLTARNSVGSVSVPVTINTGCTASSTSATTTASSGCGMPLNLAGQRITPRLMTGTWFEYLYNTPGIDDINTVDTYNPLGCILDSANNRFGVVVNWTAFFNLVAPGSPCVGIFGVLNITSDGKKTGQAFFLGRPAAVPVEYITLFTDYQLVDFYYRCAEPNLQTGRCTTPFFFVVTRVRPSDLTDAQRTYIDNIINTRLAPYCYSINDLDVTAYDNSLPQCIPPKPAGLDSLVQSAPRADCNASGIGFCTGG